MPTVNTGIVAHVDAGKTSLTERLLFRAGVIGELGSVDAGNTQTDSMDIERQRGITIRSAVVSLTVDGRTVNLIDTPGHSDFIAEVERSLGVLDGVVLVVSAVEGVQAQTRVLMRTLRALNLPVLIFVNKIDRLGARAEELLAEIRRTIAPGAIALSAVSDIGTKHARVRPCQPANLAESLAENDEAFLLRYLEESEKITEPDLRAEFVAQVRRPLVQPVFFGSAMTGVGVEELLAGIGTFLPATEPVDGEPSGVVFKIDRGRAGEKVSYVRLYAGSIEARQSLVLRRSGGVEYQERVTSVAVFDRGTHRVSRRARAGDIAVVGGLTGARIGDRIGSSDRIDTTTHFPLPSLETVVSPGRAGDAGRLFAALAELPEQDPFIDVRQDPISGDISVRLYGEVQKEVIRARLAEDYGVVAGFAPTRLVYVEKPVGVGSAAEAMAGYFFGTVGLRVEPGERESGVVFRLAVELGSLPLSFHKAIEETVRATLQQGLYGWEVTDIVVTLSRSGFISPLSTAGDFRKITPLVLMSALVKAGTAVHEPFQEFELDIPANALSPVLALLTGSRARLREPELDGESYRLRGELAAARMPDVERALPGLTQGEGALAARPGGYRPISGPPPTRERRDGNPLDRDEYLLRVLKHL
jgi:ribosomal protection tetracycline resistance protein